MEVLHSRRRQSRTLSQRAYRRADGPDSRGDESGKKKSAMQGGSENSGGRSAVLAAVVQRRGFRAPPLARGTRFAFHGKLQLSGDAQAGRKLIRERARQSLRHHDSGYSSALAICATGIAPSRPIRQVSPFNSTIVDGSVPPVSPVSSTSGTRSPSCFMTCSALEHDGNPEMFALVPVTGPSNSSIRRRTTLLFGQRNAMRPVPAVT